MTEQLYLSRARLRSSRGEALSAIAPLLIPDDPNQQAGHAHRILWMLFQDVSDAKRDFLWRDDRGGKYLILSRRLPTDPHGLFELDTKAFEPDLASGQRLRFALRANPTVALKGARPVDEQGTRTRGQRVDVVMAALHDIPSGQRAQHRDRIAREATSVWLNGQGAKAGFRVDGDLAVDGYTQIGVERKRGRPAGFSVLDMEGRIEITDPAAFLGKLAQGFGSAKAFGNGLMLIRRT